MDESLSNYIFFFSSQVEVNISELSVGKFERSAPLKQRVESCK